MTRKVNISDLNIRIVGTAAGFAKTARNAARNARELEAAVVNSNERMGLSAGRLAASLTAAFAALRAGSALKNFIEDSARLAIEFEQTRAAFGGLVGDVEEADRLLDGLADFARLTPFSLPGVTQSARQLLAFGVTADNVIATLSTLGDVAAGSGSDLQEIARIYGRVFVADRAQAEEINQLLDRGIPILSALADQLRINEAEVRRLSEQGRIGIRELQDAFIALTQEGEIFGSATERQAKTTAGQWQQLQGEVLAFKRNIGEELLPTISEALQTFRQFASAGGDIQESAKGVADTVELIATALRGLATAYRFAQSGATAFLEEAARTAAAVLEPFEAITGEDFTSGFDALIDELERKVGDVGQSAADIWNGVANEDARQAASDFGSIADTIGEDADSMAERLRNSAESIRQSGRTIADEAARLTERIRTGIATPEDRLRDEAADIFRAFQFGGLEEAEIGKALDAAAKRFLDAKRKLDTALLADRAGALTLGSQQEFAARTELVFDRQGLDLDAIQEQANQIIGDEREVLFEQVAGLGRLIDGDIPIQAASSRTDSPVQVSESSNAAANRQRETANKFLGKVAAGVDQQNALLIEIARQPAPEPVLIQEFGP